MFLAQAEQVAKSADRATDMVFGQGIFAVLFVVTLLAIAWFVYHVYHRLEPHVVKFVESTVSLHNSLQVSFIEINSRVGTIEELLEKQGATLDGNGTQLRELHADLRAHHFRAKTA